VIEQYIVRVQVKAEIKVSRSVSIQRVPKNFQFVSQYALIPQLFGLNDNEIHFAISLSIQDVVGF